VSADPAPNGANTDEPGRSDATDFFGADRTARMSSRHVPWLVVALVVTALAVGGTVTGSDAATARPTGPDDPVVRTAGTDHPVPGPSAATGDEQSENGSDGGPGGRLAGTVAVGGSEVGSGVDTAAFDAVLAATTSDAERADIVATRLDGAAGRLDALERRIDSLERARSNGSLSPDRSRARGADAVARIRAVRAVLDRAETATVTLDGERGDRLGERVADLRDRARSLLDADLRAAARAIDGADVDGTAAPIDLAEVVAAYERSGGRAPGPWVALFGSERIALHVERADGRTAVFGLHTSGGDIVESTRGPPENPTLRVETDYRVVRGVAGGEDPWEVASRALASDRITYRGVGAVATLKYGLVALALFFFDGLRALLFGALDLLAGVVDLLRSSF